MREAIFGASLVLAAVGIARTGQAAPPPEPASSFGQKWISTRLAVGARFTYYWLEDSRRAGENGYDNGNLEGNFLGSLWGFDVSPGWAAPGRRFEVQDTDGWFVTAGCKMSLAKHVGVDVMFRHSHVGDVASRAYFRPNRYREGSFPMRYDALAIGGLYTF